MSNCHLVAGRSLIDLAASRLALHAPAQRAATALTRPNGSARWLPCGRRAAPTAVTVDPSRTVTEHGVERGDHLTHYRHDDDLRLLSGRREAIVECFERRIPIAGAHRRHEEHVADWRATAPHATLSLELATLEGIRRNAYQRSDLLATHAAEFGQERNQGTGQHRSDARHGGEQSVSVRERRIGHNDLDQALIEHVDIGCEASDAATRKPLQHGIFEQSGGILGGDFLGAELAANGKHLDEPFERWGAWLRRASGHDGDERRDHAGIERIVLSQNPARLGELPQLERIDLAHGHAGCEQRAHDTTLVASASLKSD